jgi:hypothetical protein
MEREKEIVEFMRYLGYEVLHTMNVYHIDMSFSKDFDDYHITINISCNNGYIEDLMGNITTFKGIFDGRCEELSYEDVKTMDDLKSKITHINRELNLEHLMS